MPILLDGKNYRCDMCGGIFGFIRNEEWSNEKATEEFHELFPDSDINKIDIVCDDCWEKVKPSKPVYRFD